MLSNVSQNTDVVVASQPQQIGTSPGGVPLSDTTTEAESGQQTASDEKKSNLIEIKAPMVGTFYSSPAPDADPYVREGDSISNGKILCIIEAMKLMNEIESENSGKIVQILVENAQPVEYDQPLFLVEPS